MTRGYIAGCCVIVAAAGLGYWIFAEKLPPHRPPPPTLTPHDSGENANTDKIETYGTRPSLEVIDLARAYDPTGEELDLNTLLHGKPVAELAPSPRSNDAEVAPPPREAEREMLHQPRIIQADFREPTMEAESTGSFFPEPFATSLTCLLAEWLMHALPLK